MVGVQQRPVSLGNGDARAVQQVLRPAHGRPAAPALLRLLLLAFPIILFSVTSLPQNQSTPLPCDSNYSTHSKIMFMCSVWALLFAPC